MFITTFLNIKRGNEVTDVGEIALNYVKSKRFFFDFLAILGNPIFSEYIWHTLEWFSIFKLVRIHRLSLLIGSLNTNTEIKTYINIAKLILYLLLWINI